MVAFNACCYSSSQNTSQLKKYRPRISASVDDVEGSFDIVHLQLHQVKLRDFEMDNLSSCDCSSVGC
jgi:hypothetical protein